MREVSHCSLSSEKTQIDFWLCYCRYDKLKNHCGILPATILVGTKGDLRQSSQHVHALISTADCLLAARNLGLPYTEVSCYTQDKIETAFENIITMIQRGREVRVPVDANNNVDITRPVKPPEKKGICENLC